MTIKTQVKEIEENKVEIQVEIPIEQVKESIEAAYRALSKKAKIPGFRQGKVPPKVIDTQFGKGAVLEQALRDDLGKFYIQAVEETGIVPVNSPNIEIQEMAEEKPLKFTATVEVKPKVKLGNYKQLKTKKKLSKVEQKDIDAQLQMIRDKFANLEVAKNKVAQQQDYLLINFDGTINGKAFEGGSAKDYLLGLGSKTMVPGFEEQLVGSKAGEIKDIKITFPKDYPKEDLAGKIANFRVFIKEVKVKKLPELNEDFVKQLGEYKNLDELKKEIKVQLREQMDKKAEAEYKAEVLKEVSEQAKISIPKVMIDDMAKRLANEFDLSLRNQGASLEQYQKATGTSEADILKKFDKQAESTVKENLVLEAISEKENIEPTDEEVDAEVKKFAKDQDLDKVKKELEAKGLIDYLRTNLRYSKTLDWLATQAGTRDKG
ncbi:MAG: trigger factor [Actinobacteria bacterium]|nr:MAG: trigger factor [Actinomycetota bacterium]